MTAQRVMAVLDPIKLIITNYPEDLVEEFEIENNPNCPEDGTRTITFSRESWIERSDFTEEPVKGYFRFYPGNEVRMKTTYIVKCTGCKKDENGNVIEVYGSMILKHGAVPLRTAEKYAELFIGLMRKMLWMLKFVYMIIYLLRQIRKQASYWNVSILNL